MYWMSTVRLDQLGDISNLELNSPPSSLSSNDVGHPCAVQQCVGRCKGFI
jgi:hypothetical protein